MGGNVKDYNSGALTYIDPKTGDIFASGVGVLQRGTMPDPNGRIMLSVGGVTKEKVLPKVNDIVLCEVTKIEASKAVSTIHCVETRAVKESNCEGIIRVQDVYEKRAEVRLSKCFRCGDIVRARV